MQRSNFYCASLCTPIFLVTVWLACKLVSLSTPSVSLPSFTSLLTHNTQNERLRMGTNSPFCARCSVCTQARIVPRGRDRFVMSARFLPGRTTAHSSNALPLACMPPCLFFSPYFSRHPTPSLSFSGCGLHITGSRPNLFECLLYMLLFTFWHVLFRSFQEGSSNVSSTLSLDTALLLVVWACGCLSCSRL